MVLCGPAILQALFLECAMRSRSVVSAEVMKCIRTRNAIKAAQIAPGLRDRMLAEVEAQLAVLEAEFVQLDAAAPGAVQAPQAGQKAR